MITTFKNYPGKAGIFSTTISVLLLFVSCENERIDLLDPQLTKGILKSFSICENENLVKVTSIDGSLVFSFQKEDFNLLDKAHDFSRKIRIDNQKFTCQYNEKFSNTLWTIEPVDIIFKNPVEILIHYTHEEFAPDFDVQNLKIYQLKRKYIPPGNNNFDPRMFRLSDMKILETSEQDECELTVRAEIDQLGSFVVGRKLNIKGELF